MRTRTTRAAAAATGAAVLLTLAMAWPVVVAPGSRVFGSEMDGRHHDPFTVMRQFESGPPPFPLRQPLVDDAGGLLARVIGPVPAYNVIVLATFPLTVLTTFLLARYAGLSNIGAAVAAFAFAFAPLHTAHAAYHPHTAQTQWLPLYFLALWMARARPSPRRLAFWAATAAALALSNWYGAFIAAFMTPFAAKWGQTPFKNWGLFPFLLAFPAADLARYGAQPVAYLLPPVNHPLWGGLATDAWAARGMTGALVEQQVSLSWALLLLAAVPVARWMRTRRTGPSDPRLYLVPALVALALASAWFSLAPPAGTSPWWVPSTWIHPVLPMFRAYARFAFVTHLMVALLAGLGVTLLLDRRHGPARGRTAAALALLTIAAFELAPLPARARDVLPTAAHRWVTDQAADGRVLDCVDRSLSDAHLGWLMRRDITPLPPALPSCHEQQAASRAAALGYRFAIARHGAGMWAAPEGFTLVRDFGASAVYDIVAPAAPVVISDIEGFYDLEVDGSRSWRWLARDGRWRFRVDRPRDVQLDLHLAAHGHERRLALSLDGRSLAELDVRPEGGWHRVPLTGLRPGLHDLTFTALEAPAPAPAPDARRLSIMLRDWRWR